MSQSETKSPLSKYIADANHEKQPETMQATEALHQPRTTCAVDTGTAASYFNEITIIEDEPKSQDQKTPNARTIQRKTRLSKTEDEKFLARIAESGKSQSDFIRDAILSSKIYSLELPHEACAACEALLNEGGRIKSLSGFMIQTLKISKEYHTLTRDDIMAMNAIIRQLQDIGDQLIRKGDVLHGYLQACIRA